MIGLLNFCHVVHQHNLVVFRIFYLICLVLTRTITLTVFEGTTIAVNVLHEILVKLSLEH